MTYGEALTAYKAADEAFNRVIKVYKPIALRYLQGGADVSEYNKIRARYDMAEKVFDDAYSVMQEFDEVESLIEGIVQLPKPWMD